jgi:hypothetical protein
MSQALNEPISVITIYNSDKQTVMPYKVKWHGRDYKITKLGYHHKVRVGRTLIHIFSICTETTAFKLQLDTDTLHWIVEEIYEESAIQ